MTNAKSLLELTSAANTITDETRADFSGLTPQQLQRFLGQQDLLQARRVMKAPGFGISPS